MMPRTPHSPRDLRTPRAQRTVARPTPWLLLCLSPLAVLAPPLLTLSACEDPTRYVPPVHPMIQASEDLAAPGHSLEERVSALSAATSAHHEEHGPELTGTLEEGRVQEFHLTLRGTFCYIVAGAAEDSLEVLDLELVDDNDVLLLADGDPSRMATMGIRQAICPMHPRAYKLRVSATRGSGSFSVRIFQASNI